MFLAVVPLMSLFAPAVKWDPSLHLNTYLFQRLNKGPGEVASPFSFPVSLVFSKIHKERPEYWGENDLPVRLYSCPSESRVNHTCGE